MTGRSRDVDKTLQISCEMCRLIVTSAIIVICMLIQQPRALDAINPDCATVMCAEPCPPGQYIALNEHGCESCTCYDPCESFSCDADEECHWTLDRETDRPAPFCASCSGGREWNACGGGTHCIATCINTLPICPRNCYPGCYCPPERPIWHHNNCITVDECKESCDGNQVWTDCGSLTTLTCTNPDQDQDQAPCLPRCICPYDRPIWDADRQMCVAVHDCSTYWT